MLKKTKPLMCCLLILSILAIQPISIANAACYIREIVPAVNEQCASSCEGDTCSGGVSQCPQYYTCASAGSGESGKCSCSGSLQQISTWWPCEEDIEWGGYITCILGVAGCAVVCAVCILEPTKLTCIACAIECGAAGAGCYFVDYCDCVKGDSQDTYRYVFSSLSGGSCEG